MKIPVTYNLRNLSVRKMTTIMTALGTALSVAVLVAVLALVDGLRTSFQATGHPRQLLVTRKGSSAELTSVVTRANFQDMRCNPAIELDWEGQPMASLEMVTVIDVESPGLEQMNVNLRGLTPTGLAMREQLVIVEGRFFYPGQREVTVGKGIADRYRSLRVGNTLQFGRGEWKITGIFDGGQSAFNSEIFVDLNQLSSDYNRVGYLSSVLLRVKRGYLEQFADDLEHDRRLNVSVQPERDYYAAQTRSAQPMQFMGIFIAIIMAVGSTFAAMNTMFAAVARRAAEIGTLRVLGFSRLSILTSFLIESLLLALLGGIAGCVLVLPLNNLKTGIGSFTTFAELTFNFHIGAQTVLTGIAFALVIGTLGGLLPAHSASRKQILTALRGA